MALLLEPVRRVRLMSLVGDFATCTERSEGPVTRRGNMFETRRPYGPLGAHGLSFLVETVYNAIELTGERRVHAVVGGFHLCGAPRARIASTVRDLRRLAPRFVIPSHCSGLTFEAALEQAFPRGFIMDSVGSDYVFER